MIRKMLLMLVFLMGAAVAVYHIAGITGEYRAGEKVYREVQTFAQLPEQQEAAIEQPPLPEETQQTQPEETTAVSQETREPLAYPEVDFEGLRRINRDVLGWIYMEDTRINYPIVQGEDNRYYVSTLIDGTYNGAGSIFLDYRNNRDLSDRHVILYGHNMKNGTMFADITRYRDQEYYDAHPAGVVVTPDGQYRFDVVAAYIASLADASWQLEFVDDGDALAWVTAAMDRSPFVSHIQPEAGDRMITLSTCTYEFDDARFVLVGILSEN